METFCKNFCRASSSFGLRVSHWASDGAFSGPVHVLAEEPGLSCQNKGTAYLMHAPAYID